MKNKMKAQPLKFLVIIILFIMLIGILSRGLFSFRNTETDIGEKNVAMKELSVFVQDGCIYCTNAEDFLSINKFKNVRVVYYNLKDESSLAFFFKVVTKLNIPQKNLGTPVFVFGDKYIIGFGEKQKQELISIIDR